jgi:hypothetical protein
VKSGRKVPHKKHTIHIIVLRKELTNMKVQRTKATWSKCDVSKKFDGYSTVA